MPASSTDPGPLPGENRTEPPEHLLPVVPAGYRYGQQGLRTHTGGATAGGGCQAVGKVLANTPLRGGGRARSDGCAAAPANLRTDDGRARNSRRRGPLPRRGPASSGTIRPAGARAFDVRAPRAQQPGAARTWSIACAASAPALTVVLHEGSAGYPGQPGRIEALLALVAFAAPPGRHPGLAPPPDEPPRRRISRREGLEPRQPRRRACLRECSSWAGVARRLLRDWREQPEFRPPWT